MKCKSIKIILSLSLSLCALLIPVFPVSALEDENLLSTVPETQKHYETSEYGAIMQRLANYKVKKAGLLHFNMSKIQIMLIIALFFCQIFVSFMLYGVVLYDIIPLGGPFYET